MRLVLKLMMSPIRRGFTPLVWRAAVVAGISLTANVRGAREAGGLYGRIIDAESGEPVVAAKVMLGKDGLIRFSDGDGMFRYTDLRPRRYTLSVAATGYSPWVLSGVRVEPGVDVSVGIELRASRPVTAACDTCPAPSLLLGRVTDAKEAGAIKGASILIPSLDMAAETGDDGYFSVAGVQEGTYDVVVGHAEYAADTVHDIAVGPPHARAYGTAVDGNDCGAGTGQRFGRGDHAGKCIAVKYGIYDVERYRGAFRTCRHTRGQLHASGDQMGL